MQKTARIYLQFYQSINLLINEIMKFVDSKKKYFKDVLYEIDAKEFVEQEKILSKKSDVASQFLLDEKKL